MRPTKLSHNTFLTDGQTTMAIARPLLKYTVG